MSPQTYEDLLQEAERLPPDQCLKLIERLVHHMRTAQGGQDAAHAWEDYAGSAPYPLCGEDAQEWVRRRREESDEARQTR